MGAHDSDLVQLVEEIRSVSATISGADAATNARIDEIEKAVNALLRKAGRPGSTNNNSDDTDERKDAIALCCIKHALDTPKDDGSRAPYEPSAAEVDNALTHTKALRKLFRHGDPARLDPSERKSLSSFSFGSNAFVLSPEMSDRVLSCIIEPTGDISSLVDSINISGASVKFLIDNVRTGDAAWACEASCFANNPQPDLQEGLGELEIKAESLRFIVCATSDLLQDAALDVEGWLMRKVSEGFKRSINKSILLGDGIGKPLGLLNPNSGVPICDTGAATQLGQFTWQDLVMLKWELPQQWQEGGLYVMNQRTYALLLTMTDAVGRPLMVSDPTAPGRKLLDGSPIQINNAMPDVSAGTTPVLFANLKRAYLLVQRRATTLLTDPYTAGFCVLYKFDARVGGAPTCPNAARLLRIR